MHAHALRAVICAVVVGTLASCDTPPQTSSAVDVQQMREMLALPTWTDDEWQEWCSRTTEGESGHCSVVVQVDCPPDCGIYRLVREDRLARRLW